MTKKYELMDCSADEIKNHMLDPDNSTLPENLRYQLDRIVSITKVIDKNPVLKQAVAIHQAKYQDISMVTAYADAKMSMRLYNSFMKFDYDFWQEWIIKDIVESIAITRKRDSVAADKVIAMQHANLIKAIGKRPEDVPDPKRNEKHNFFIMVNVGGQQMRIDPDELHKLPVKSISEINKALSAGQTITIEDAKNIMDS